MHIYVSIPVLNAQADMKLEYQPLIKTSHVFIQEMTSYFPSI